MKFNKKTNTFLYSGDIKEEMRKVKIERERIVKNLKDEEPLFERLRKERQRKVERMELIDSFLVNANIYLKEQEAKENESTSAEDKGQAAT